MKINISYFGHYSFLALKDNVEMLKNCLIDCDYEITITNSFSDGINFIYEGHHPDNYDKTIKELKNKKNNKFIICTEELVSNKFLPKTFYTFNHHEINRLKYQNKKFLCLLKLVSLNLKIYCFHFFMKHGLETKLKKFFPNFNIKNEINLKNEEIVWKDRYDFFLKTINFYQGIISTYDRQNYQDLKLKNFLFLPHLFSKKDIINISNEKDKEYDLLFTGQMNEYREITLNKLKKKFKLKILSLLTEKERIFYLSKSKVFIGLFKNRFQSLSSVSRTYHCIRNRILLLNQKPFIMDHLDNPDYLFDENTLEKKIQYILSNYSTSKKEFINYCNFVIKKFQAQNYKNKIDNFLKKNLRS